MVVDDHIMVQQQSGVITSVPVDDLTADGIRLTTGWSRHPVAADDGEGVWMIDDGGDGNPPAIEFIYVTTGDVLEPRMLPSRARFGFALGSRTVDFVTPPSGGVYRWQDEGWIRVIGRSGDRRRRASPTRRDLR